MLTSELIRAARMLLRWDQETLSQKSGVPLTTLKKLELRPGPLATRGGTEDRLRAAIESAGVEFTNGGQPGVRMRKGDANVVDMPSAAGPSHDGQIAGIRDRMTKEDATKTPEKGMEALQRGRAKNEQRRAAAKKGARNKKSPAEVSARTIIAKGAEARGKAETAVDKALAGVDAGHEEKAGRKRKLTSMPKELKP